MLRFWSMLAQACRNETLGPGLKSCWQNVNDECWIGSVVQPCWSFCLHQCVAGALLELSCLDVPLKDTCLMYTAVATGDSRECSPRGKSVRVGAKLPRPVAAVVNVKSFDLVSSVFAAGMSRGSSVLVSHLLLFLDFCNLLLEYAFQSIISSSQHQHILDLDSVSPSVFGECFHILPSVLDLSIRQLHQSGCELRRGSDVVRCSHVVNHTANLQPESRFEGFFCRHDGRVTVLKIRRLCGL